MKCDSVEYFYDCISCVSENECVKCAEVTCDIDDIGVVNDCEDVEILFCI